MHVFYFYNSGEPTGRPTRQTLLISLENKGFRYRKKGDEQGVYPILCPSDNFLPPTPNPALRYEKIFPFKTDYEVVIN